MVLVCFLLNSNHFQIEDNWRKIIRRFPYMITKDKLERINKLAKKAKKEGLNDKEKKEQQQLRQEYLQNVRNSFTDQFKTMTVMDAAGNDVTPKKVKEFKKKSNKH